MNNSKLIEILRGNFEKIKEENSKTVKIFLSSTFSDTHAERDYLIEHVYPKLREYCKKTYGLEFQIYDMRWGISHDITITHSTTTVCLNEIRNCQKYSVGPNFIAFLSHRYGSRSLPTRVIAQEFRILQAELDSSDSYSKNFEYQDQEKSIDLSIENMLENCYELDDNETPARFRLKQIDKIIPDFNNNDPGFWKVWNKLEHELGNLLRRLADQCFSKKLLNQTQHERYFVSVTEKEIFNGILTANNTKQNVVYFQRDIEGIEDNIETNVNLVKRFIELDENNKVDKSVKRLLDDLKYKKIPSKLPESNIFKFNVKWDKDSGISFKSHPDYIKQFGETFYQQVKKLIDKNQEKKLKTHEISEEDNELLQEVLDHASFCNETVSMFHGRDDILQEVRKYILDDKNRTPFVLFGESGCGKTAVLAKVTSQILKVVPDPENYSVLLRFLGTTPTSSDIIKTIKGLVHQMSIIFKIPKIKRKIQTQSDARDILMEILDLIQIKHPDKKIIIILDSVDQLNPSYYNCQWLINCLPENVKFIYSTLPFHGDILKTLRNKLEFDKNNDNFLEICSLDTKLSEMIILDWLQKSKRSLSEIQLKTLKDLFPNALLYPLYIKLIFDIVSKWKSFYVPDDEFKRCLKIDDCIVYMFKSFEKIHGKLLFTRTIIYMSLFKNGISENEIEDILSLDDDVLYDIFEYHAPPVRRLPIALWARIKNDLKEYMVEKEVDDTRVIYWYHRRFIEVANSYYIIPLNVAEIESIFSNVVDFFNETWKNKPKPYKYNEYLTKKFGVKNTETEATRDTGMQPTVMIGPDGEVKYNKRKLSELPSFVIKLTPNISIPLACDIIFFDYHFLTGLINCVSFNEIFEVINKIDVSSYNMGDSIKSAYDQLNMYRLAFLLSCSVMTENPQFCMIHFLSRNLNFYNNLSYFTKLINEYFKESPKFDPLILCHQYLDPPMGDLLFQMDKHSLPVTHLQLDHINRRFIFSLSNKIDIFDFGSLNSLGTIKLPVNEHEIKFFNSCIDNFDIPDSILLSQLRGGFLISTLNEIYFIDYNSILKLKIEFKTHTISQVYLLDSNLILVFLEGTNYINLYELTNGKIEKTEIFDVNVTKMSVSLNKDSIIELRDSNHVYLGVTLENQEIHVFEIDNNNVTIKRTLIIPSIRLCVKSVDFYASFASLKDVYGPNSDQLIVVYENSNLCIIDLANKEMVYISYNKSLMTPIDNINDIILFTDLDRKLILLDTITMKFYEIDGCFTKACFMGYKRVAVTEGEKLSIFDLNSEDDQLRVTKMGSIDAHFEEITFLGRRDEILITASKDSTIKMFFSNMLEYLSDAKMDLHKSNNQIKELIQIDEEYLISTTLNSNQIHFWNRPNGKIVHTHEFSNEQKIFKVFFIGSKMFTLSLTDERNLRIRAFNLRIENNKFSIEEKCRLDIDQVQNCKCAFDSKRNELFLLIDKNDTISYVSLDENLKKQCEKSDLKIQENNTTINFESISICLTNFSKRLLVVYGTHLHFINKQNGMIENSKKIVQDEMNMEYFLFPTNITINRFHNINSIDNTDNLIMLDNIGHLHFVEYYSKAVKCFKSTQYAFESFRVNKNLLLGLDKNRTRLVCFSLKTIFETKSLNQNQFSINLTKEETINHYGFNPSNTCVFLIYKKKVFQFYKIDLNGIKKLGELNLYAEVTSVLFTDEFISLAMQDRKVVSYLLNIEKNKESVKERIKKLNILPEREDSLKKKNKLIVDNLSQIFDQSSDEDIAVDDILDESNERYKNIRDRVKKNVRFVKGQIFEKKHVCLDDENWAVKLKKDLILSDETNEKHLEDINRINKQDHDEMIDILRKSREFKPINTQNTGLNVTTANNYSSSTCLIQ